MIAVLEQFAKIPLPRLIISVGLLIVFLYTLENFDFAQSVVRHVLNMEGIVK